MPVLYKKYSAIEDIYLMMFTKTPSTTECHWISVGKEQPRQYLH